MKFPLLVVASRRFTHCLILLTQWGLTSCDKHEKAENASIQVVSITKVPHLPDVKSMSYPDAVAVFEGTILSEESVVFATWIVTNRVKLPHYRLKPGDTVEIKSNGILSDAPLMVRQAQRFDDTSNFELPVLWSPEVEIRSQSGKLAETAGAKMPADNVLKQTASGGAGDSWAEKIASLAPYRAKMKSVIAGLPSISPEGKTEAQIAMLKPTLIGEKGRLNEWWAEVYTDYITKVDSVEPWSGQTAVRPAILTAKKWLEARGVRLVFVMIPVSSEVYPDVFFPQETPPDRIVAPHVRKLAADIQADGVTVVDLLPQMLKARSEDDGELLYWPLDPHWAPRGMKVAAKSIAAVLDASLRRTDSPFVQVDAPLPEGWFGAGGDSVDATVKAVAAAAAPKVLQKTVTRDGLPPQDVNAKSPVVLIGDSYCFASPVPEANFRAQLVHELGSPVHMISTGGDTVHAFREFMRNPTLLEEVKTVVWISVGVSLAGADRWDVSWLK